MKILINTVITFSSVLLLTGCGGTSEYDFDTAEIPMEEEVHIGPIFDPANGLLPTTNNLFFAGSEDGTLNIPNADENPIITQVNTLDGFSSINPITADFGTDIDPTSVILGETVRVFNITDPAGVTELDATQIAAVASGKTLALVPITPLDPSSNYAVAVTSGVMDTTGAASTASASYILTKNPESLTGDLAALEPIRVANTSTEGLLSSVANPPLATSDIVLSWSFKTQSSTAILESLASSLVAQSLVVAPTGANTNQINEALAGIADVYIGTLDVPYYLDPENSLTSYWDNVPTAVTTLTVPVMMTLPNASSGQARPDAGWPIVIYQHGITRNRTDVLAYADAQAQAGIAVIAIDLPTHGLTDTTLPFHADNTDFADTEQTFGVDADGVDGVDDSGTHFINLASLLTSRDNLRQGVSNLLTLRRSLGGMVNALTMGLEPIDTTKVGLIAHSLGGMVAVPYLGVESTSTPSSLLTTGATISKVLSESETFGPRISEGLVDFGITTEEGITAFYGGAQWIVGAADPANYAEAAVTNHSIHMIEVLGDETVPNSSTENLANLLGATSLSTTTPGIAAGNAGIVRFTEGDHASPLDPTASLAATIEIQSQLAVFQASSGTIIQITDGNVIQ